MVYDNRGRSHSSPGFSYHRKNYHREKTPEEKEHERIEQKQRESLLKLEQTVKTTSKVLPAQAQELVAIKATTQRQLWQSFLETLGNHYDDDVVANVSTVTAKGVLSFGRLIDTGVPTEVAVEIYQD